MTDGCSRLGQPINSAEFSEFMARLGGFEPNPLLAVGVSGGADSLALCLITHAWAQARGGAVVALTVDHHLRSESTHEAKTVGLMLAARGITHRIINWDGAKPATALQDAARQARYRLMSDFCLDAGILHLLLAHHREDQAETMLMRLARTSGADGLAAMAALRETKELRLLRPLLDQPKARLAATCESFGQSWLTDPSNHSLRFARGRLRAADDALAGLGLNAGGLAATARRLGQVRAALDDATALLLARVATVDQAGLIRINHRQLASAPGEIGRRALARCLMVVGGGRYSPRREGLDRLFDAVVNGGSGRTLGGCRIVPYDDQLLVVREANALATVAVTAGVPVWWDRRFRVGVRVRANDMASTDGSLMSVARLGACGWRELRDRIRPDLRKMVPDPARAALPALWDGDGLLAAPHFGYTRPGSVLAAVEMFFAPVQPLAGAAFGVV
ncbi:MAG: tRNA lysidine(34) synthetase TilS [Rhodospirillaceae bacterium]